MNNKTNPSPLPDMRSSGENMDRRLKPRPWYVKFRYFLLAGVAFTALLAYAVAVSVSPRQVRVKGEEITVAPAEQGKFMEYVDVEGVVHPILTLKVNARESGFVDRVVAEEGAMLCAGDTILVLKNPDLLRVIEDEQDEWERQQRTYQEQEIEMQQRSITLRQQTLDAEYEMRNLDDRLKLSREEYRMGIKSKAELDVAEAEYTYRKQKSALQMQSLRHDSVAAQLRHDLLRGDIERANKKRCRSHERINGLVITAPCDGQLSYLGVTPGQQVGSGSSVGEIKVLSSYKVRVALNEYYIDRITAGQPASITYQQKEFPLRVSRVVPEVKDRSFSADLTPPQPSPTGEGALSSPSTNANASSSSPSPVGEGRGGVWPDNVRIGKSYRVKIELGKPETALVIPRGDFYGITGGQWIYRVTADGTRAIRVPITIGRQNPKQYEVTSGLKEGDRVIVSGYEHFGDAESLTIK